MEPLDVLSPIHKKRKIDVGELQSILSDASGGISLSALVAKTGMDGGQLYGMLQGLIGESVYEKNGMYFPL